MSQHIIQKGDFVSYKYSKYYTFTALVLEILGHGEALIEYYTSDINDEEDEDYEEEKEDCEEGQTSHPLQAAELYNREEERVSLKHLSIVHRRAC